MPFREPSWWYGPSPSAAQVLLTPAASIWGLIAARRMRTPPRHPSPLPVICIGNFTAGGTGKTPLARWIAEQLIERQHTPVFLTRGYGSQVHGATAVDLARHSAADVGDEALLLARTAPVMVSPDRAAGARAIASGMIAADVILMDDGMQNPALAKDLVIAVVDGVRKFGNGSVIPAGPLRAPLGVQAGTADAVVVNGTDADCARVRALLGPAFAGPLLAARTEPAGDTAWLAGARVFAFAGIGNPDRFFRLLERLGATIAGRRTFADHHVFTDAEAARLMADAKDARAVLVTTEKDFVRLSEAGAQGALKRASKPLPIRMVFEGAGDAVLLERIAAALAR